MPPKYPKITVKLTGEDGNAFAILGSVVAKLKQENIPTDEIAKFKKEAMSGDYDHLLQTVMAWITAE
ncbi:MAG: hypothetical protein WC341_00565 [Bacteroidales bacterium]|jgi:hypothetical protein